MRKNARVQIDKRGEIGTALFGGMEPTERVRATASYRSGGRRTRNPLMQARTRSGHQGKNERQNNR